MGESISAAFAQCAALYSDRTIFRTGVCVPISNLTFKVLSPDPRVPGFTDETDGLPDGTSQLFYSPPRTVVYQIPVTGSTATLPITLFVPATLSGSVMAKINVDGPGDGGGYEGAVHIMISDAVPLLLPHQQSQHPNVSLSGGPGLTISFSLRADPSTDPVSASSANDSISFSLGAATTVFLQPPSPH
jgi:hypothetical protein